MKNIFFELRVDPGLSPGRKDRANAFGSLARSKKTIVIIIPNAMPLLGKTGGSHVKKHLFELRGDSGSGPGMTGYRDLISNSFFEWFFLKPK